MLLKWMAGWLLDCQLPGSILRAQLLCGVFKRRRRHSPRPIKNQAAIALVRLAVQPIQFGRMPTKEATIAPNNAEKTIAANATS